MESRGPKCYGCQRYGHIRRNCPENMYSSAAPKSFEHRNPVNKGRNVTYLTQDELESESDSEHNTVTHHALSAVESLINVSNMSEKNESAKFDGIVELQVKMSCQTKLFGWRRRQHGY